MRANPIDIQPEKKILVLSPHPDDESIGAGGVILKYSSQCTVVVMTDGRYGNPVYKSGEMKKIREAEFVEAMKVASVERHRIMGVEDGTLIFHKEIFKELRIEQFDYVFLPNPRDNHSDHTACCEHALNVLNEMGKHDAKIFLYEVHTPLPETDYYLDIGDVMEKKQSLLKCYSSQMEMHSYVGQVKSLAEYRGFQNELPGRFHEAYKRIVLKDWKSESNTMETELAKYKYFTRMLGAWIQSDRDVGEIASCLISRGYCEIAIYGYGVLGRILYQQLERTTCKVKCIIDKDKKVTSTIKVYHDLKDVESVDAVVITVMSGADNIAMELRKKCGLKSVCLDELIQSLERE